MGRCLLCQRILHLVILILTLPLCQSPGFEENFSRHKLAPSSEISNRPSHSTRHLTARDGARIHYKVKGNPEAKRTLVFLHGFAADAYSWLQVLRNNRRLLHDYRIILITFRGHGKGNRYSELGKVEPDKYYEVLVQDIADILEAENISSAILIGHSMGGEIARYFYAVRKAQVEALVLISSYCRFPLSDNPVLQKLKFDTLLGGAARLLSRFPNVVQALEWYKNRVLTRTLLGPLRWGIRYLSNGILFADVKPDHFYKEYLPVALSTSFQAYIFGLAAMGSLNGNASQPVRVPSLIIHGKDDRLVLPIQAKLLQEQIPGAQVHICNGRHFPHLDQTKFPRILFNFLDSLDIESSS